MSFSLNGQAVALTCPPQTLLVEALRRCGLSGTPVGCDTAQCGACTVLVDGHATKSCNLLAAQVTGCAVTTVEGLDHTSNNPPHLLRRLFSRHHALQCGFCTSGMLMRAMAMVTENIDATPSAVRHALAGNLCRCTGYEGIVNAIVQALPVLRGEGARAQAQAESSGLSARQRLRLLNVSATGPNR
jgi:aerobic carbon-monoxide dehydrogenase small subunit